MLAALVISQLRVLTWCCVIMLAILSLLPAEEMVRTGLPGRLEHFAAYAGSAAIAVAGYGATRGSTQIIGGLSVYAGIREYFQHFSPGRHPAIEGFAASALGALCGRLAVALLLRRVSVWAHCGSDPSDGRTWLSAGAPEPWFSDRARREWPARYMSGLRFIPSLSRIGAGGGYPWPVATLGASGECQ